MDAECLLPREGEDPRQLPLSLLETITNNFSEDMKLGSGGFAVVYKGVLGSRKVAVKKLSGANDMDEKQFIKEIECLMKVRHKNIVRFLGYCADTQGLLQDFGGKSILADVRKRALCFEYVPKGSLDKYITDASSGLEWRVRCKMIKGICQGLHYLHKNQILHLDLKPANILVDDNMIPKIADFGLSRLLDQNQSMVIATTVMGSLGYFAPECYDREFSKKSDVYSLGVVIMEIMSGKKFPTPKEVIASWRNRREKWEEDIPLEHVKACADIGAMCINHIAEERPTTQHIIKVLKDLGDTDEFKEAGSSNSLESQMDEKTRIAYDVLKRMLLDESEEPKELPLSLLEAITNNFSDELELSRAGFAVVYKGMLGTRTVSVKKLAGMIDMDENQFSKEVQCLMKVRHKNIVRFLGYCVDTKSEAAEFGRNSVLAGVQNRVFCFEYASNGNLNKHITDASCGLEWTVRYEMIKGICQGLYCLHQNSILHLDLEPSNILVDENMVPKIADFCLSRRFDRNENYVMSASLIRKIGYWAPEFHTGETTFKSDIYSLGLIIMEILTGEKRFSTDEEVLRSWGNRLDISQGDEQKLRVCAEIGMKCMDTNPRKRPTTQDIIKMFMGLQSEKINVLIACVTKNLGYSAGKPVAAVTIYKCLLHWKSLEADKTSLFNRLIQLIESAIQTNEENNDMLAYWLTNTSSLLFLLHRSIKAASISRNKPPQPKSLFGRMVQGLHPASFTNIQHEANDEVIHEVEAKYPALLFKQQLTACVEKIYGTVRDNMKRELSYLISLCVQAPRTMKARNKIRRPSAPSVPDESQSNHWVKIIEGLDNLLMIVQDNHVPDSLAQNIFMQIFTYINVQLFNSVLLRRECCSFSNGEYIRAGLADLESWCAKATTKYAASSWDELKHIRQAVGFLVIFQKFRISYDEIVNDLCPILSVQQLYRICTQYWDDKYNTQSVSSDVLSNLRVVMTEDSKNPRSNSLLLDDNASIPFTVDDITNSQQDFSDVRPAKELLDNPDFEFLQDH